MQTIKTRISGTELVCVKEMRRARRYQLNEVMAFSWKDADGTESRRTGITQNISMNGICFVTSAVVEVGARLKLEIFLPSSNRLTRAIQLHADGVVRQVRPLGIIENRIVAEIAFHEDPDDVFLASEGIP